MPSTFAPFGLVLLAAGREPSGFSRLFDHVTGRLAPFRYKVDGIGLAPDPLQSRWHWSLGGVRCDRHRSTFHTIGCETPGTSSA